MIYYLMLCFFCFCVFVYINWKDGCDLSLSTLGIIAVFSLVPVLNIGGCLYMISLSDFFMEKK